MVTGTYDVMLKTPMGKTAFDCTGTVDGNTVTGSVKPNKGTLALTGKRQ